MKPRWEVGEPEVKGLYLEEQKSLGLGQPEEWNWIFGLSPMRYESRLHCKFTATSGKSLNLSEPQFSHLYFAWLLRINEIVYIIWWCVVSDT